MAASYKYLGVRGPVVGTADNTGFNPGNWNVVFTPVILNFTVPEIFIFKLNVKGAVGSSFDVRIETQLHDSAVFGNQNSWYDNADDSLIVRPTETFYLMYNDPVTDNTPPVAWAFLRYDLNKWGISENYG